MSFLDLLYGFCFWLQKFKKPFLDSRTLSDGRNGLPLPSYLASLHSYYPPGCLYFTASKAETTLSGTRRLITKRLLFFNLFALLIAKARRDLYHISHHIRSWFYGRKSRKHRRNRKNEDSSKYSCKNLRYVNCKY